MKLITLLLISIFTFNIQAFAIEENIRTYTETDIEILAKMAWGEARGLSDEEIALTVWTVLQRVDNPRWPDSIAAVVRQPNQFIGYRSNHPVDENIRTIVEEALVAWVDDELAPVLYPFAKTRPYYFFSGRNGHNWFCEHYRR